MKEYTTKSMRRAYKLRKQGFKVVRYGYDRCNGNYIYLKFIFENTKELQTALKRIRKIKGEDKR